MKIILFFLIFINSLLFASAPKDFNLTEVKKSISSKCNIPSEYTLFTQTSVYDETEANRHAWGSVDKDIRCYGFSSNNNDGSVKVYSVEYDLLDERTSTYHWYNVRYDVSIPPACTDKPAKGWLLYPMKNHECVSYSDLDEYKKRKFSQEGALVCNTCFAPPYDKNNCTYPNYLDTSTGVALCSPLIQKDNNISKKDCNGTLKSYDNGTSGKMMWNGTKCVTSEPTFIPCEKYTREVIGGYASACDMETHLFSFSCIDGSLNNGKLIPTKINHSCVLKPITTLDDKNATLTKPKNTNDVNNTNKSFVPPKEDIKKDNSPKVGLDGSKIDNNNSSNPSVLKDTKSGKLVKSKESNWNVNLSKSGMNLGEIKTYSTSQKIVTNADLKNDKKAKRSGGSGGNSLTDNLKNMGKKIKDNSDKENNNTDAINVNTDATNSNTNAVNANTKATQDLDKTLKDNNKKIENSKIDFASTGFSGVTDKYSNIDLGFQTSDCPTFSPVTFTLKNGDTYTIFSQETINQLPMNIIRRIIVFSFIMSALFLVFRN